MNKQVYEKNMEALAKKFPAWATLLSQKRKQRGFDVIAEESMLGDTILKVKQKDRILYLNGRYAPSAAGEAWLEKQGKIEEYAPIIVIGISNGVHIRQIMEAAPKTANILIYEPSLELFRREIEEVDLSFLFQMDIPVGIIIEGFNQVEIELYFHRMISYDNMTSLKCYESGNYAELFPKEVKKFINLLYKYVEMQCVNWNTYTRYTSIKAKNVFHNLPYLYQGYSAGELENILPEDVPVIVVSAGPSLNKNLKDLKKAVGKACIIATDTAMKPLLNAGITPNLFVIVDGLKPGILFEHKNISKVPMVTMTEVSIASMDAHKGKKFFYYSGSPFENRILMDLSEQEKRVMTLPSFESGGSVATTAYSLGRYMGAKTIILVGQDLALTGNRTHADGTFQEKMEEIQIDRNDSFYMEVDAVDGGKVLTRGDLKVYLEWFEKYIKKWSDMTTVDATEGGALIHGSKIMTLKNAIRKYCAHEFNVKWHIDHTKKIFSAENQNIPLQYFENAEDKFHEVAKKAKEGLLQYEKLEKAAKKKSLSEKELAKLLKRVKKINKFIEYDHMAEMVVDSLSGVESVIRPSIYRMQEDRRKELLDIAEQGKVLLYSMVIAAEEIAGIAHDTVVPFAKEQLAEKVE